MLPRHARSRSLLLASTVAAALLCVTGWMAVSFALPQRLTVSQPTTLHQSKHLGSVSQPFRLTGISADPSDLQKPMVLREAEAAAAAAPEKKSGGGLDIGLIIYFALWYLGNYYYNITNKLALKAAGGVAGYPFTIASLQLGVGCIYALFLWAAPDARSAPSITMADYLKTLPVAFCSMGAHVASVFALSAGAVSFGQIVKAAEPAFAAIIGTIFYAKKQSTAKWLCLIPVVGGVMISSLAELSFAWAALFAASVANIFAAIKANENKKLIETEGLKDRMGSVGNQFALTTLSGFLFCLPVMLITEGSKLGSFWALARGNPVVSFNLIASGLWFYGYNELATMTLKKTGAVTQSVANTAKRAIVIVGVAIILGESLSPLKLAGSLICIGGVFLYSIIDDLVKKK